MAPENDGNTQQPTHLCTEHSGILANQSNFGRSIDEFREAVKGLTEKIGEFSQRPSRAITAVIAIQTGIIGSLATFILYACFAAKP